MTIRRTAIGTAALLTTLALAGTARAYEIDYAPDRPAELLECDAARHRGEQTAARDCYLALRIDHADLRIKAEAAWAVGDIQGANGYFQQAFDEYPEDPRLRTRWGKLFSVTDKNNEAVKLYQEALVLDPSYVPAIVGLAEVAAGRFEGQAREWVVEALELDPEAIKGHLLHATMELEVGNLDSADRSLDTALEIAERKGVAPLEIYALKASADLLRDDFESEWIARALEYNPRYGKAYATPAYFFVITRRYREAIDFYERALEIEPDLYEAHAELGINLLRENRVEEAYRHLDIAHTGYPFLNRVTNTGRLIDSLDNFSVETYGAETTPPGAGAGVILRLHKDEAPILTPYVLELVNQSIEAFSERYGFSPEEPVVAEMYPNESDFSVRTAGLPGIGLLGVAFGYLVAMNSPPPGTAADFHWGTTLWHEVAHVFTLKSTNHLVPRWFSEGASVYEEWSTGPLRGRHIPGSVFGAMVEDKFLPVAELDEGFIRPAYQNQVIVSYMQAGLICEYIAATWGQEALRAMLARFREGDETAAAIEAALGIPPEEFDRRFARHIEAEFGDLLANFEDWQTAQQEMHAHVGQSDWAEARTAAERAIALYPSYVDQGSAYLVLARVLSDAGDTAAARETLATYYELGGYDPGALLRLARWHEDEGDTGAAIDVLEATLLVAPLDPSVHERLGDLLLAQRPADALREFEALMALEPHDLASVHLRLAKAHLGLEDRAEANEHLLYALEIAPHYREAQQLLLEIVR
jgi:tetratricopeptide (TPR) repeat protein